MMPLLWIFGIPAAEGASSNEHCNLVLWSEYQVSATM